MTTITIFINDGPGGQPPIVRATGVEHLAGNSDAAYVAKVMLKSAAYLFAQSQPVRFGDEIPVEHLK